MDNSIQKSFDDMPKHKRFENMRQVREKKPLGGALESLHHTERTIDLSSSRSRLY